MATNPTIKAVVTAEDKASGTLNKFSQTLDNVGKQVQTANLLSENFRKSFTGMTGAIASGAGKYDMLNAQLSIVRQRMAEAESGGKTNTSTMMALELQAAKLQGQMGKLGTAQQTASQSANQSSISFRGMAGAMALGQAAVNVMSSALGKLQQAGAAAIGQAADFEGYRVSFETMLHSADLARDMLQRLSDFALKTPFNIQGVVEGAKQIMAYGVSADQVIPTMKVLGDIAAGVGKEKLPRLTLAFGQITAAQRLYATELRQLTEAGVPIINELVKVTGRGASQIRDDMEKGVGPSLENVKQAMFNMTQEGGVFFNLMEKQSQTFSGTMANIGDQAGRAVRSILGISEQGDIKQGGPFYYLKRGAEAFLGFLSSNAGTIAAVFQGIMQGIIVVASGVKGVIEGLGPGFLITATSATIFGASLLGLVKVGTTVFGLLRTFGAFLMGPLGIAITAVSILAGIVLTNALKKLHGQIGQTVGKATDYGKLFKIDVPNGMAATSAAAAKMGKKIADINDQIERSNRDFREGLAEMVKSSEEKVASITAQLAKENQTFSEAQAEKESDFKDSQDKMIDDHNDRVKKIQDDIEKETRMGVLADKYKLEDLKDKLNDENTEYNKQFAKNKTKYEKDTQNAKEQHEEKVSELQKQLDKETTLLQKHAEEIKGIRNVTLLDEVDKLKRSHEENLKSLQQQRDDKSASDAAMGDDAVAANQALAERLIKQGSLYSEAGFTQGKALSQGFGQALKDSVPQPVKDVLSTVGQAFKDFFGNFQSFVPPIMGLVTAFEILRRTMVFDAIFEALSLGFKVFREVAIAKTLLAVEGLRVAVSTPMIGGGLVITGFLADLGLLWKAFNTVKQAFKDISNKNKAFTSFQASQAEVVDQLKAQAYTGDQAARTRALNALHGLGVQGFAAGGNVVAGRSILVGEQGPEIYTPGMSGKITPNNQVTNVQQSQPTINVTINAQAFAGSQMEARKFATMIMGAYQDAMSARGAA